MTDRALTLTVILEGPIRTDDAEPIMDAIRQLRGVHSVVVGEINNSAHELALMRAKMKLREQVVNVLFDGIL